MRLATMSVTGSRESLRCDSQILRFRQTQRLCQKHRDKTAGFSIRQPFFHGFNGIKEFTEELINFVRLILALKKLLHIAMLCQKNIQGIEPSPDEAGHLQKPEGMSGGGGIHNNGFKITGVDPSRQFPKTP